MRAFRVSSIDMSSEVQHEKAFHRFAVHFGDATALLAYKEEGDTLYLVHTEVPALMEGKGIGSELAKASLEYARQRGLRVVARCPFVVSYLERHPEFNDLLGA